MSNPYESPQWAQKPAANAASQAAIYQPGLVSHVQIVCVLMIVHGVLDILTGGLFGSMGVLVPTILEDVNVNQPGNKLNNRRGDMDAEQVAQVKQFMFYVYFGMGLPAILTGILLIVAAIRNFGFRNRVLGIVALILGLGASTTCYCIPTSIALTVYGLIVLLNREVQIAFELRNQGESMDSVLARFSNQSSAYSPPELR